MVQAAGCRVSSMVPRSHGEVQADPLCKPLQSCQLSSAIAVLAANAFGPLWVNFCNPTILQGLDVHVRS